MANFIGLVYATLKNEGVDTSGMSTDEAVAKFKELQKKSGGDTGKEGTPAEQRKLEEKGVVDKGKRAGEYKFYETSKRVSQADKLSDSDREIVDDAIYWAKKNGEASVKSVFEQLEQDMSGFLSYGKNGNYEAVRDYISEQVFTDKEKSETFTDKEPEKPVEKFNSIRDELSDEAKNIWDSGIKRLMSYGYTKEEAENGQGKYLEDLTKNFSGSKSDLIISWREDFE